MKKFSVLSILFTVLLWIPAAQSQVLSGTITQWKDGKQTPVVGARVIIGVNINLDTRTGDDKIQNPAGIVDSVVTGPGGTFTAKVPAGSGYTIIVWKAHYTPQVDFNVRVPGTYNGSISYDSQVGADGRHMSLSHAR